MNELMDGWKNGRIKDGRKKGEKEGSGERKGEDKEGWRKERIKD